jgi:hypothetical protein
MPILFRFRAYRSTAAAGRTELIERTVLAEDEDRGPVLCTRVQTRYTSPIVET